MLFEHQCFLMQGLHIVYLFMVLDLPKEFDVLLDPPPSQDCDNWERITLNHHVINNLHSDPLQESIYKRSVEVSEVLIENCLSTLKCKNTIFPSKLGMIYQLFCLIKYTILIVVWP